MTPDELHAEIAHQRDLRDTHRKNLRVVEQQAAAYGAALVPMHIATGIEDLKVQIAQCDLTLASLESQATPADPRFGPGHRRAVVVGVGQAINVSQIPARTDAARTAQDLATRGASPAARFALPNGTASLMHHRTDRPTLRTMPCP